jgi:hypothetical protein
MGRVNRAATEKSKNHDIVQCVTHDFYVKINPGQKSGDAVACANVAPVRLRRLICHKGINTWSNHCTMEEEWGGGLSTYYTLLALGRSLPMSPVLGIICRSVGRHPKKLFLKATATPQIRLWQKVRRFRK